MTVSHLHQNYSFLVLIKMADRQRKTVSIIKTFLSYDLRTFNIDVNFTSLMNFFQELMRVCSILTCICSGALARDTRQRTTMGNEVIYPSEKIW